MRRLLLPALFLALSGPAAVAAATDPLAEMRAAYAACEAARRAAPDDWIGWRRSFFNGYRDDFAWWDNRDTARPSLLVTAADIDGIARQVDTACYRTDGSLAFVFTVLTAPRLAPDGARAGGTEPARIEGRIYFDRKGAIVRTLGWIADARGRKAARLDDPDWRLARGCRAVVLHRTLDAIEAHYLSVLGDIDGNRPSFTPEEHDWCAAAKPE